MWKHGWFLLTVIHSYICIIKCSEILADTKRLIAAWAVTLQAIRPAMPQIVCLHNWSPRPSIEIFVIDVRPDQV